MKEDYVEDLKTIFKGWLSVRKHISKSGKIVECKAKNVCPLGTAISVEKAEEKLKDSLNGKHTQEGKLEYYIEHNLKFNPDGAHERGLYLEKLVEMYVNNESTISHAKEKMKL